MLFLAHHTFVKIEAIENSAMDHQTNKTEQHRLINEVVAEWRYVICQKNRFEQRHDYVPGNDISHDD